MHVQDLYTVCRVHALAAPYENYLPPRWLLCKGLVDSRWQRTPLTSNAPLASLSPCWCLLDPSGLQGNEKELRTVWSTTTAMQPKATHRWSSSVHAPASGSFGLTFSQSSHQPPSPCMHRTSSLLITPTRPSSSVHHSPSPTLSSLASALSLQPYSRAWSLATVTLRLGPTAGRVPALTFRFELSVFAPFHRLPPPPPPTTTHHTLPPSLLGLARSSHPSGHHHHHQPTYSPISCSEHSTKNASNHSSSPLSTKHAAHHACLHLSARRPDAHGTPNARRRTTNESTRDFGLVSRNWYSPAYPAYP